MINKQPSTKARITAIFGTFIALTLVSTLVGHAWSPPVQAGPTSPPREPSDEDEGGDGDDQEPFGAYIELHGGAAGSGLWAIIQWQDSTGQWHDVEGWRSQVEPNQVIQWWVAPKDLNTGPYRWVVYTAQDRRRVVWSSQSFYLPKRGETLRVSASAQLPSGFERPDHIAVPPKEHRSPETLMPVTGGSLDTMPRLVTTALSVIATLILVVGGLAAAHQRGPVA